MSIIRAQCKACVIPHRQRKNQKAEPTQVLSSALTASPPAMCGKATFAIAASSSSMNVASGTVIAMSQGLMPVLGTGRLSAVTGVNVSLMAMLNTLDAEETVRSHLFYAKIGKRDQSVPFTGAQIGRCNDQGRTDQTANRSKSR